MKLCRIREVIKMTKSEDIPFFAFFCKYNLYFDKFFEIFNLPMFKIFGSKIEIVQGFWKNYTLIKSFFHYLSNLAKMQNI